LNLFAARTRHDPAPKMRVLAAEISGGSEAARVTLLERLAWARLDEVVMVPRVPVDSRHNAKVDYPALLRLLDRLRPPT
jgi:hypothetical protein